jgi:hypothetical protein
MTEVLENLDMTKIWPKTCLWITSTYYTEKAYQCSKQNVSDTCFPCWLSPFPCGFEFEYSFVDGGCSLYDYYPWVGQSFRRRRRLTSSRLLKLEGPGVNLASAETRAIEGYAGTFALPSNNVRSM